MKISTKGRYALRVMIDLAEHNTGEYIKLTDIAERQGVSEKYLERIIGVLSKNGFVAALRGKGGGYKLARDPQSYSVASIIELMEGSLAPIACLEGVTNECERSSECKAIPMWEQLYKIVKEYLESVSVADLAFGDSSGDYYVI